VETVTLNRIRWSITTASIVALTAHYLWPRFALDTTSIILLVIGLVPWLAPVIKSIELPGGFKIEVQDVKEATDKVTAVAKEPIDANLGGMRTANVRIDDSGDSLRMLQQLVHSDPNLRSE